MARASVETQLPLDTFARLTGIHPLHFNQVVVADIAPARTCGQPILQYAWQNSDHVGREEVAMVIAQAEDGLTQQLGFRPLARWEVDDRVSIPRPSNPELYHANALNVRGQLLSVKANNGYIYTGGIEAKSLIDDAVAIVYSDSDGDGYDETATITVATTVTSPEEIAIYYPGESGAGDWEIKPLKSVAISGGNAVIVCRREQLVLPDLMEALDVEAVDGLDNSQFLTTVDVYRHYNDPQQQVQFLWERQPNYCGCSSSECTNCTMSTQWGCLNVRDYRLGFLAFSPATWNTADSAFDAAEWDIARAPDRARLWYRAGWKDPRLTYPNLQMDQKWARAITYMALAALDRPFCDCNVLDHVTRYWREDLAANISSPDQSSSFQLSQRKIDNPFGTTRAGLYAWDLVQKERLL